MRKNLWVHRVVTPIAAGVNPIPGMTLQKLKIVRIITSLLYLFSGTKILTGLLSDVVSGTPPRLSFIIIAILLWVFGHYLAAYRLMFNKSFASWLTSFSVSSLVLLLFLPLFLLGIIPFNQTFAEIVGLHIFGVLISIFMYRWESKIET